MARESKTRPGRTSRPGKSKAHPAPRGFSLARREALWAYIFLLVPLAFFLYLRIYPALQSFQLSLFTWHIDPARREFVGLGYYQRMLQDSALQRALRNTLHYALVIVPLQLVLGLGIAVLLNNIRRFQTVFRAIYFAPYITPAVAVTWVWGWMYSSNFGILNSMIIEWSIFVEGIGLPGLALEPINFLRDPSIALYSVAALVIWQGIGFQVVIFLAGLKGIPQHFLEAAAIDGATPLQCFFYITLPLLNPVIVFSVVISSIGTLQLFDQVVNLNFGDQGGPLNSTLTVALYIYQQAFSSFRLGYASAITVLLFVIILIITFVQLKVITRRIEY